MSYETIRLETDGRVARLTLDRPAVLNAITGRSADTANDQHLDGEPE